MIKKDKMRMYLGWQMHLFGFCTAIASGTFLGIINSTQYTLEQYILLFIYKILKTGWWLSVGKNGYKLDLKVQNG